MERTALNASAISNALRRALRVHWKLPKNLREANRDEFHRFAMSLLHAVSYSAPSWVQGLARSAGKKTDAIVQKHAKERLRAWRLTLGVDPDHPGRLARPKSAAFRWVRDYAGWKHSPMGKQSSDDDVPIENIADNESCITSSDDQLLLDYANRCPNALVPLSEQAAVDAECSKWASLWKEGECYNAPDFGQLSEEPLQLLSVWAIRQAAATFPSGTGLGADNISPRAMSRLSDEGVAALSHIYSRLEAMGEWTAVLNLVLIVLLPKLDGGLRPIGLFPTLIRLWMRARVWIARKWEAEHSLPCVYGGVSMGAHRAAWCENFSAEFAGNAKADHRRWLIS